MSFNNGLERKRFDSNWSRLHEEYTALGVDKDAIEELYQFDLTEFNSNRRFIEHPQELSTSDCDDDDEGDDSKSVLLNKFAEALSINDNASSEHNRYWWVEEIDSPKIAKALRRLSNEYIELLTLMIFDGYSQVEIAELQGTTKQGINNKIARIKNILFNRVLLSLLVGYHLRGQINFPRWVP